jgi:hypothetical protein
MIVSHAWRVQRTTTETMSVSKHAFVLSRLFIQFQKAKCPRRREPSPLRALSPERVAGASTSFTPGRLRRIAGGRRWRVLRHCSAVSHGANSQVAVGGLCCSNDDVVPIMTLTPTLLDSIKTPADLRGVNEEDLRQVADELRSETIDAVAVTGGHLGAGLGVVGTHRRAALRVQHAG